MYRTRSNSSSISRVPSEVIQPVSVSSQVELIISNHSPSVPSGTLTPIAGQLALTGRSNTPLQKQTRRDKLTKHKVNKSSKLPIHSYPSIDVRQHREQELNRESAIPCDGPQMEY